MKGCVLGKKTLDVEGFLRLKNVLHVEGLKVNLISINQPCDQNLLVKFNKKTCKVLNESQECVLERARSFDNCYKLVHSCIYAVCGVFGEDETMNLIEEVENKMQKDNVIPDVTHDVATSSETKSENESFDINDPVIKDRPTKIQKNHPIGNIIGKRTLAHYPQ